MAHLTKDKSVKARWTCVYPTYIDANKTLVRDLFRAYIQLFLTKCLHAARPLSPGHPVFCRTARLVPLCLIVETCELCHVVTPAISICNCRLKADGSRRWWQ